MTCPFTLDQIDWLSGNLKIETSVHKSRAYWDNSTIKVKLLLENQVISEHEDYLYE